MRPEHYFKGDRCEYTGKSEILHGALCYEFEFMEGHRLAQFGWTYHKPAAKPTGNGSVGLPVGSAKEEIIAVYKERGKQAVCGKGGFWVRGAGF